MARKNYSVDEVIRSLSKKHDCKLDTKVNTIEVLKHKVHDKNFNLVDNPKAKFDLGNGSRGKIDFLVNHQGWSCIYVGQFQ